jgi:glucosamine-6-phosphate deaminase
MEIRIFKESHEASVAGASTIAKLIKEKPNAVLGLATGGTPSKMYAELIALHKEGSLSFSDVTTFNLDEYLGLEGDHPCSFRHFMNEKLFEHIDININSTHVPDGSTKDVPSTCADYEEKIKNAGGIDLQVLGLGSDGHIGFNEPTSSLTSRTRIKTLSQKTCEDNARFFDSIDDVPKHCITMGIGSIMDAGRIVLLAFGEQKAAAVKDMVEGALSAMIPASALQMHQHVLVLLDEAAASELKHQDYYNRIVDNKPEWQR